MRKIGTMQDKATADLFSDYLLSLDITIELREQSEGLGLWVVDDIHLDTARQALTEFQADPSAPKFAAAKPVAKKKRKAAQDVEDRYQRRRKLAIARNSTQQSTPISMGVIALSILVAVITKLGDDLTYGVYLVISTMQASAGLVQVFNGEIWRLITPAFLHFGLLHIGFNLYIWWSYARYVEARKGTRFFLAFFLTTAIFSNLVQYAYDAYAFPAAAPVFGGLSGVLYGLLAYQWVKGRIDPTDRIDLDQRTVIFFGIFFLLGFTPLMGHVANFCHLGGLLWGALYARLDVAWFDFQKRR